MLWGGSGRVTTRLVKVMGVHASKMMVVVLSISMSPIAPSRAGAHPPLGEVEGERAREVNDNAENTSLQHHIGNE